MSVPAQIKLAYFDGFELTDPPQTLWKQRYGLGAVTLNTDVGRDGLGRALRYSVNAAISLTIPLAGLLINPVIGFGFKFTDLNDCDLLAMTYGGSHQLALKFVRDSSSTGHLKLQASTVLAEMEVGSLVADRWYFVELQTRIANAGAYELRIDMIQVFSSSSADTQTTGSSGANGWAINLNPGAAGSVSIDDVYIIDAGSASSSSFLGNAVRAQALRPVDDRSVEYVGSYANVDDAVSDGDATYNSNSGGTRTDIFDLTPLDTSVVAGNFVSMYTLIEHRVDTVGTIQVAGIAFDIRFGTTTEYDPTAFSSTAYSLLIFAVDSRSAMFERQDLATPHTGYKSIV